MRSCSACQATLWEGARRCHACGADLREHEPVEPIVDALIGRTLGGKFLLRELIGAGAHGFVFRADQTTLGRTVAVKVLRPHLSGDPEVVRRFEGEAVAASRLNHPSVVSVIDYGRTDDGQLFLVMEYLRGRSLTQVLRAEFPVPLARVVGLMSQVIDALEEAHAAGVVHADLKADNVVVETLRGGGDLVKVVDFGIARLMDTTPRAPGATAPAGGWPDGTDPGRHTIAGTPEYMAPEVIAGGELTPAADQYAAGILLYELLTGVTPFAGGSVMEVLARHIRDDAPAPSTARPELSIPRRLEEALARTLAKQPAERFASVSELKAALAASVAQVTGPAPGGQVRACPSCGAENPARFKFCPECGDRCEVTSVGPSPLLPPSADERATRTETLRWAPAPSPTLFPLPLLGRDAEVASIEQFLSGGDAAGIMLVVAATGAGKSRLTAEACRRAGESGTFVAIAGADPSGLKSAWYPIRAAVAAVLELPPVFEPLELAQRLEAIGLTARDAPGLTELFGPMGEITQLDVVVRRREAMASALRVLRAAGRGRERAALVFEDADGYDSLSRELLARLTAHPLEAGVRVLVTTTPEQAGAWPEGIARLELGTLDAEALSPLGARITQSSIGDADLGKLAERSGGVPLYVEQALRWLMEGGELATLPGGLADLIASRADRLPAAVRVVLQAAAVHGVETDIGILRGIVARRGIDDVGLFAAIDLLCAHGFLHEEHTLVVFDHPLVRDVVYDGTPADARRELHRAYAAALPEGSPAALIGHHADLGGQPELAMPQLLAAGDAASRGFDDHGAAAMYRRALAAGRRLLAAGDEEGKLRAFLITSVKLADALRLVGEHVPARGIIDEALGHCDGRERATEALLRRAHAYLLLAQDDPRRALEPLETAIGLALGAGRLDLLCTLYLDVATARMRCGEPAEAARELEEGIDTVTIGEGLGGKEGPPDLWRLGLRLAELQHQTGQRRDALVTATHSLRHAERVRSRLGHARANMLLGHFYEVERDHPAASRHRAVAVEAMRHLGDRRATAELLVATATTGQLRIQLDQLAEARTLAEEIGWSDGMRSSQGRG